MVKTYADHIGCWLENLGLQLYENKTKLIEFGRFSKLSREQREERKPKVFNFFGFTHICSTKRSDGEFAVMRITQKLILYKKIKQVQQYCLRNRSTHIKEQVVRVR